MRRRSTQGDPWGPNEHWWRWPYTRSHHPCLFAPRASDVVCLDLRLTGLT
jgi:hypothetical protein